MKAKTNDSSTITKTSYKHFFKKPWVPTVFWSVLLFFTIISGARIPYIGQFFDSVIFSFLFGYAKYLIYLYLLIFTVAKIFKVNCKPLFAKRLMLFIVLAASGLALCFGGIEILRNNYAELFNFYLTDVWYGTIWNFDNYFVFGYPNYFDGGFIGAFFGNLAGLFIILFSVIFVMICYFVIFRKHWEWCKSKILRKRQVKAEYEIKKVGSHKFSSFRNLLPGKPKNSHYLNNMLAVHKNDRFSFKDCVVKNTVDLKHEAELLSQYFDSNDIEITSITNNENEFNYYLDIKTTNDEYQKIYNQKEMLKLVGLTNGYHLVISEEMLRIEYPKIINTVNHALVSFLKTPMEIPLDFPICLSEYLSNQAEQESVLVNFQTNYFIGIFDAYNANSNILNILVSAISVNYARTDVLITYINPLNDFEILTTSLCSLAPIIEMTDIHAFVTRMHQHVTNLISKIKEAKVVDIYGLNNHAKSTVKNHVIIVNNVDYIKLQDPALFKELVALKEFASICGITLVFVDHSRRAITFEDVDYPLIVSFYMDAEISKKVFDTGIASTLEKKNNICLFSSIKNYKIKGYVPTMNEKEKKILLDKFTTVQNQFEI